MFQHNKCSKNPHRRIRNLKKQTVWPTFPSQGFNDGLEELCKIQKGWAIPDKEQRDSIRQSQKKVVSDAYRSFLQRWGGWKHTLEEFDVLTLMLQLIQQSKGSLVDVGME